MIQEIRRRNEPLLVGGMYGQGLYFSPQHGFAIAWHAHQPDGRAKLIAYADTLE